MKQLSKECLETIDSIIEKYYPKELGYNNVITTLDSVQNTQRRNCCEWGMDTALTTPEIYEKAGLVLQSELEKLREENKYLKDKIENRRNNTTPIN